MICEPDTFNPFSSFNTITSLFITKSEENMTLDRENIKKFNNFILILGIEFNPKFNANIKLDSYTDKEKELKGYRNDLLTHSQQLTSEKDKSLIIATIKELDKLIITLSKTIQEKIKFVFSRKLDFLYSQEYSSRKYLEDYLDVSQQTISTYFNGTGLPSLDKLLKISSLLNCSIDYLLKEDVVELDIGDDIIYKEIGLSSKSRNLLMVHKNKGDKHYNRISNTLNSLVEGTEHYETDILFSMSDFLYPSSDYLPNPLHTVSRNVFEVFYESLSECKSVDDALVSYENFLSNIDDDERFRKDTFKDLDTLHLTIIQKKLILLKEKVIKEFGEKELELYANIFDGPNDLATIPLNHELNHRNKSK